MGIGIKMTQEEYDAAVELAIEQEEKFQQQEEKFQHKQQKSNEEMDNVTYGHFEDNETDEERKVRQAQLDNSIQEWENDGCVGDLPL